MLLSLALLCFARGSSGGSLAFPLCCERLKRCLYVKHFLNVGGGRYPTHNYFWLSLNIFLYNYNYYNKKYLKKMLVLVWCWGSLYTFDSLHFVLIPVPLCCVLLRLWVVEGLPSVLYCHFDFSGSPLLVSDFVVVLMLCVVEALPSDFLRPFPFG